MANWLVAHIAALDSPEGAAGAYRAWRRGERTQENMRPVTLVLRKGVLQGRHGKTVYDLIQGLAQPPLRGNGRWKSTVVLRDSGRTLHTFLIDDDMALSLEERDWEVELPSYSVEVRYRDLAGLRARTNTTRPITEAVARQIDREQAELEAEGDDELEQAMMVASLAEPATDSPPSK